MKLGALIEGKRAITLSTLSDDKELSRDIQEQLIRLGILAPKADGAFGPQSLMAGREFVRLVSGGEAPALDYRMAKKLVDAKPEKLLPAKAGNDLAGAIWQAMEERSYWLSRVPGHVNIVYVEGANADGSPNPNEKNKFNDLRLVITVKDGVPVIVGQWQATTEPGEFYTERPMIPEKGAARIAFGQYRSWNVGMHGKDPDRHEALVQVDEIKVHRDLNKDYKRDGDAIDTGSSFAVNQHWGYDNSEDNVGRASAGCLVGRTRKGHREFMAILKADPRYQASNGYHFLTAVLAAEDIQHYLA